MRASRVAVLVASLSIVAGCAGRGAESPLLPPGAGPAAVPAAAAARVTPGDGTNAVAATVVLPDAVAHAKQIAVVGALYPSYVSSTVGNNTQILTPKGKVLSAKMQFTGVPHGNNEWAVVSFYNYASNGSTVYIGTEAAVLNVDKPTVNVLVNEQTTQVFQATMALLGAGLITAQDLIDTPKLPAAIEAAIKSAKLKPDRTTGLFNPQQLQNFVVKETPKWQRKVTIEADSSVRVISISNSLKLPSEGYLASNTKNFLGSTTGVQPRPAGAPCGNTIPTHVPGTNPTPAPISCASIYGTSNGRLSIPVYGNSIVVGASTGRIPFAAVTQLLPYRKPGTSATLKLGALKNSEILVPVSDAFDWAFGTSPSVVVQSSNNAAAQPFGVVANYYTGWSYSKTLPVQYGVPSNFSSKNPNVIVNGWNPFNVANANFSFCTSWNVCSSLLVGGKVTIDPPFADPGTNLRYFDWKGLSGTAIAAVKGCPGYVVTPKHLSTVASIISTRPTVLVQSQNLTFHFNASAGCGGVPAPGSIVSVAALSTTGVTFTGQGVSAAANPRAIVVAMDNFLPLATIKQISITITQAGGKPGPIGLVTVQSPYTP